MKKIGEGISVVDIQKATNDELFLCLGELLSRHNINDPKKDYTVLAQQLTIEIKARLDKAQNQKFSEDDLRDILVTALMEGGQESGILITRPQAVDVLADTKVLQCLVSEYAIAGVHDTVFEEKIRWALVNKLTKGAIEWPCYGDTVETKRTFKRLVVEGARRLGWKLADDFEKGYE